MTTSTLYRPHLSLVCGPEIMQSHKDQDQGEKLIYIIQLKGHSAVKMLSGPFLVYVQVCLRDAAEPDGLYLRFALNFMGRNINDVSFAE